MRSKTKTINYYCGLLGFRQIGLHDFDGYLMVEKDNIQIHFFEHTSLNPLENDGQVYIRTDHIDEVYQFLIDQQIAIHPHGHLEIKPWGQKEFSLLDPDHNLLTFGEKV